MGINERLCNNKPKYILSLDGGGVRGVLTLAFLERAEKLLAEHYKTGSAFRLCDHYSLIGGTSTGAIISTGLALGYNVEEMIDIALYRQRLLPTLDVYLEACLLFQNFPLNNSKSVLKHTSKNSH